MAVNKNFVVKNGLEVDSNLIVADATTNKVGIGTTVPLKELDVRGDVSVSGVTTTSNLSVTGVTTTQQVLVSGISTFVGLSTFQNGIFNAGVTTSNSYAVDGTQVISSGRELQNIASLDATTTATIEAAIADAPNTFTDIKVSGLSTFVGFSTFQNDVYVAGVTTSNSYAVDGTTVINSSRELQNIASLDATTTATIEAAISNAPNTFADLTVTGVSTFVGIATFGSGIEVTSGISTFAGIGTFASDVFVDGDLTVDGSIVYATASAVNINITGIATVGTTLDINGNADFAGISTFTDDVNIGAGGTTAFFDVSTGRVGIGSAVPQTTLSVGGKTLVDSNVPIQVSTQSASSQVYYGANNNGGYGLLFGYDNFTFDGAVVRAVGASDKIDFAVNSTDRALTIDSNGNIGVNSTEPTQRLEVDGNVNVTGIVTAAGGFNIGIQSAGVDIATGVVTALNFGGTGNNIDYNAGTKTVSISIAGGGGGGGLGTAIGADYPESNIFVTPETLFVGAGSTLEIDVSADDGNVAFMRENNIVVGSGATIEITPGTEVRLDVLGVFSEPAIGATTRASFDSIIVSGLSTFTGLAAANGGLNVTGTLNANSGLNASGVSTFTNIFHTGIATFGSSNGIGTVTVGVGTTALLVDGNARVTGILTVGTASITFDGLNSKITVGTAVTVDSTGINLSQTTTGIALPQGTTAQRPSGNIPYLRWNTTNSALEFYNGTDWVEIISDYFPSGSTILG